MQAISQWLHDNIEYRYLSGRADLSAWDVLQRGSQRRRRKQRKPNHQDPAAAEQVRRTTAEQQEAAERERVRADDPLEILLREMQVLLDRRQRDVHDRDVENDHQVGDSEDCERLPALGIFMRRHLAPSLS